MSTVFKATALNADECYRCGGWAWNTRAADAVQILEAPWRGLSTRCAQRYIKRRRHWSRFVGIPQGQIYFSDSVLALPVLAALRAHPQSAPQTVCTRQFTSLQRIEDQSNLISRNNLAYKRLIPAPFFRKINLSSFIISLQAPWRGLSTCCAQRLIKRRRHWSRFVGIPQNLSPFPSPFSICTKKTTKILNLATPQYPFP